MVNEAQNVPTEAIRFKQWADRECANWPSDLQIKATKAHDELMGKSQDAYQDFLESYLIFRNSNA